MDLREGGGRGGGGPRDKDGEMERKKKERETGRGKDCREYGEQKKESVARERSARSLIYPELSRCTCTITD